jgi:hypothetical protein
MKPETIPSKFFLGRIRESIIHVGGNLPVPNKISNSSFEISEGFVKLTYKVQRKTVMTTTTNK